MNRSRMVVGLVACVWGSAACASTPTPSPELLDARYAYQRAVQDGSGRRASPELADAKASLDAAERALVERRDDELTRDLAYVAGRKARIARARAATDALSEQQERAQLAFADWDKAEQQRRLLEQQAESERKARIANEERERTALSRIEGVGVTPERNGTLVMVTGSNFPSGKTTLGEDGRARFGDIAQVLRKDPRSITVRGHTDAQGSEPTNMALSQKRAEAVRQFLIEQGIPASRIRVEAMGETQPIADNGTADGRMKNRRVELFLAE